MRVALVSPHPLEPATTGDRVRAAHLVRELRRLGVEVQVVETSYDDRPGPNGSSSVAGRPGPLPARLAWRGWLAGARLRDPYAIHRWPPLRRRLRAALDAAEPDVVDFQHTFSWFPVPYPSVVTVIDVNSHRLARRERGPFLRGSQVEAMERRACRGADVAVPLSKVDAGRVLALAGDGARVVPVALGHDPGGRLRPVRRRAATAAFVGSFGYGPNRAAARALLDRWPDVAAEGGYDRLVVVGRAAADHVRPSATVVVRSDVSDVRAALADADVLIVPLADGGGVRVKVIEAMALGLPVVSTAVGVEGLDLLDGLHAAIVEDVDGIAAGCRSVRPPEVRQRMVESAHLLWERCHRPAQMAENMLGAYELAIASRARPARRSRHETTWAARRSGP